jgi:hypothetical protein
MLEEEKTLVAGIGRSQLTGWRLLVVVLPGLEALAGVRDLRNYRNRRNLARRSMDTQGLV